MSETIEVWHNPRCSKSRMALAHLESKGIAPSVRLYLKDAPSQDEIRDMLGALDLPAAALLRKEAAALRDQPDEAIIAALAETPAFIERPIIRRGKRAVIGRPTEAIDTLF